MMEIPLHDSSSSAEPVKITQLYTHLELFSYDDPIMHSLFVLSRDNSFSLVNPTLDKVSLTDSSDESTDQLLLIDPPADEAHIRIGEHFLDIYSGLENNVAHLPAVGVLCGGGFGSDALPPAIAIGSDGGHELDTLRLLARLVKQSRIQLFILADDVAYLHGLRRLATDHVARGEKMGTFLSASEELLPAKYTASIAAEIHHRNLQILFVSAATSQAN